MSSLFSEYAEQVLLGSSKFYNNGTLSITSVNFLMPENSQFINLPGGDVTVSTSTSYGGISSVVKTIIGSSWETYNDARPTLFPLWDNQGTLRFETTGRPTNQDVFRIVADFKTSGSFHVAAGNILGFYRPVASASSNTATARDTWGGYWNTTGSVVFVGNGVKFASGFSSSGRSPINVGADGAGCLWVKEADTGVFMSLETSDDTFIHGPMELHACVSLVGSGKFNFGNVTVFDAVIKATTNVYGNMTVRRTEATDDNRFQLFSALTISGYAYMDRGSTNYDMHPMKFGSSASIAVTAAGTIDVFWIELVPRDSANVGSANVQISGTAVFRQNEVAPDWYIPTTFSSGSTTKFTGPTTSSWGGSNVVFYGATISGAMDIRDRYSAMFYGKLTVSATASWLAPSNGDVAYVQYEAPEPSRAPAAGDRTLFVAAGHTFYSMDFYGNDELVVASAVSTITFQNIMVRTMEVQSFGPIGTVFRITNSSHFDTLGYVQLEGTKWINEGYMIFDGKMRMNPNLSTKGWFINAPSGRIVATANGITTERLQLINYGDLTWGGSGVQSSGIFSNSTITLRDRIIMEDAFVLLPTNRLTYLITSRTEAPYVQFNGGFWCHVQGALHVAFNANGWTPAVDQEWSIIVTGADIECVGQFSNVTSSGLPAGLSVMATWEKNSFYGMKITICQASSAGCGTSGAQSSTKLVFQNQYLDYLPAGSYTPPAGTTTVNPPTKAGSNPNPAPGAASAPSGAICLSGSVGLLLLPLLALVL